jgi:hypothetical protein
LALQAKCGGVDQSLRAKFFGDTLTGMESFFDFVRQEPTDSAGDREIEEIGIGCNIAGGDTKDCGMSGQIDGVGDDSCGSIGLGSAFGEDRDRVCNTERKAAAPPSARSHTAYGHRRRNFKGTQKRRVFGTLHHANRVTLARGKMQGDIATIVHVRAIKFCCGSHGGENSFGYGTSHGSHGRNEATIAIWRNSVGHLPSDPARWQGRGWADTAA